MALRSSSPGTPELDSSAPVAPGTEVAVIRLTFPGRLEYRDLALRTVASACRLVPGAGDDLYESVISAFGEALNNVILHGLTAEPGDIDVEIDLAEDHLTIHLRDFGKSFDPATAPAPDLDSLPESGIGIYIMRSFMDDISYRGGRPNTLSMTKFLKRARAS